MKKRQQNKEENSLINQYHDIMKYFDFELVQEYMAWDKSRREYDDEGNLIKKRPWKMYFPDGGYRVPTVEDLKSLASSLLEDVINGYEFVQTGPFKVYKSGDKLVLECIIQGWGRI